MGGLGELWDAEAKVLMDEIVRGRVEAYAPSLLLYEVAFILLKAMSAHILKSSDGLEALMAMGHPGDRDRRDEMGGPSGDL
jgi:hypothetical protein